MAILSMKSQEALLVKRTWEALRRNDEFISDCDSLRKLKRGSPAWDRKENFLHSKWGVECFDYRRSFGEILGPTLTFDTESGPLSYVLNRLQGNVITGPDEIVYSKDLEAMIRSVATFALKGGLLTRASSGKTRSRRIIQKHNKPPWPRRITLRVDVDVNPITVMGRILFILRIAHGQRAALGYSKPYSRRIEQRLKTLESRLVPFIFAGDHFDWQQDDEVFAVWDFTIAKVTNDVIARKVWPKLYTGDLSGAGQELQQRITDYRARAKQWIKQYAEVIRVVT